MKAPVVQESSPGRWLQNYVSIENRAQVSLRGGLKEMYAPLVGRKKDGGQRGAKRRLRELAKIAIYHPTVANVPNVSAGF